VVNAGLHNIPLYLLGHGGSVYTNVFHARPSFLSDSTVLEKALAASHTGSFFDVLNTRYDSFERVMSPLQSSVPTQRNATLKDKDKHPYLQ
jgi:hypothetical protein